MLASNGDATLQQLDFVPIVTEPLVSSESSVFRSESKKRVEHYAYKWSTLETRLKPNTNTFTGRLPRSGDLVTSMILKVYTPEYYMKTLFPGVPGVFKNNKERFMIILSVLFLQRELFGGFTDNPYNTVQFKSATLSVGRGCFSSRVYRDFMRLEEGRKTRKIKDYSLFDPVTMTSHAYTLQRLELPFSIGSTTSQIPLPLISLGYHDVDIEVSFEGHVDNNVKVEIDHAFAFLPQTGRRFFAQTRHEHIIKSVGKFDVKMKPSVNSQGFVNCVLNIYYLPTTVLACRIFDPKGRVVHPRQVAYIVLVVNGGVLMKGSGIDFFTDNLKKDPRLDNDIDYDSFGMFVFRFQAPGTEHRTDALPHGTLNLSGRRNEIEIRAAINGPKEGDEFTVEFYQECVNVLLISSGMAATRFGNY